MDCAECDKPIEGKSVRFRNQFFDLNCAEVLQEDLENAITKTQLESETEEEEIVLREGDN